ncbi:hypothetical protein Glove_14g51 [Diversispora epigaea]|uniref:PAZ domain-containing protein n=1 Tax=Diversispora epigaea TaxID=1348612 RepID=A0A397JQ17_9GLOM|nr:hypothetical protein Glove_14g51 [Diversispora epigaea]
MSKRLSENSSETSKKSRNFEIRNAVDLKVAVRPGFGTEGNRFRIKTNNFRILTLPKGNLYHYKFVISTPIKVKTHLAFKIFSYMGLQNYFGGTQVVFDGNSSIYSSQTLPIGNEDEEKIDVTLPAEGRMRSKNFMVIIQKVAQIDLQSVKDYMNGTCLFTSEVQTCLSVLNTILNYKPRNTYLIVKNGIFPENFDRPRYLGNGIELKQGYCQSIRPGIEQLIVNVDVCAACFYPACSLLQFVSMVLKKNIDNLRRGITDSEKRQLEYILKEVKIRVNHRGEHQPRFKIERLSSQATDYLMFRNEKEGRDVSVVDYFVQQYNRQLEFRCLPCVVVKKSNFIPIEVCEVLPGQKFEKSIDDKLKADIIKFTCIKPQERFRTIEKGIESFFKYKEDENLNDFGIQIDSRMIEIEARLLKPPIVAYDKKSQDPEFQPRFGRWNLMNKFFPSIRPLENWSILMLTRDPVQMVEKFARELMKTLNERGMPVNTFPKIIPENLQGDIEKGLVIAIDKAQVNKNIPVQIILVFIPRKASQPYGRIKQLSDTVLGIPTQCIVSDRLRKSGDKGLLSNLALKINAKLGGRNCSLRGDQLDSVTKVPVK